MLLNSCAQRVTAGLIAFLAAGAIAPAVGAAQAPAPSAVGAWQTLPPLPPGFNAVHAVASPSGKVLLVAGSGLSAANFRAGRFKSYIWDSSTTPQWRQVPTPTDMFCAGHVLLPDGRALVIGGTIGYDPFKGAKTVYAFNFQTERYQALAPLEVGRWYPLAVTMADGRTLIASGRDENATLTRAIEIFDYRTNTHTRLPGTRLFPTYPHMHLAASGDLFYSGAAFGPTGSPAPGFWNPLTNAYRPIAPISLPTRRRSSASCFVGDVRDQVLMVMGGGPSPATSSTAVIDLDAPAPAYQAGPPLLAPKMLLNCADLPDGAVLEVGGGTDDKIAQASHEVGLLRSAAGPWTAMSPLPAGEHRLYHSLLCVLDSGQVLSTTSNPTDGPKSSSMLVYSPPYVFNGQRPTIASAPGAVTYGGRYPVTTTAAAGSTVKRIALTTYPSVTHSQDPNQRYLSLPITAGTIAFPTNPAIMPPGWYRMWAVDDHGRPSVAKPVHIS